MTPSVTFKFGLVAFAAAGVLDCLLLFVLGSPDSAPTAVVLLTAGLGVVTLCGVAAAWLGSRTGLLVAVVARVADVALGVPAFFLGAPLWVRVVLAAMIASSAAGLALTAPALRRRTVQAVRP